MSESHSEHPGHPGDPINADASDWEEAGRPSQEDSTEDQIVPADREWPLAMDEFGTTGTEKEAGEPLDVALSRDRLDTSHAGGSTARSEDEVPPPGPEDRLERREAHSAEEQAVREVDDSELE
ncbi:MAG: hypothetical protein M0026_11755 [Nocardiopsaceae bacterium]|nr:hypothetical protein [Nocardiopsaceae bacterium]